ncbi:MAG: hypothetical protein J6S85_02115 [Methanobrevibacter sp.]|nr:hypothetical protein [Methanobrevibacter sp.]
MAEGNYSLADIAAAMGGNGMGGMGGSWLAILFLIILFGGNGGWGNNFNNAIGYENLATSNEVQRGFDNQNSMANQREILSAVNSGTAQSVAATNQVYHDIVSYVGDKYSELDRDVLTVGAGVQQAIANQNQCCCDTRMLIQETSAQNRYDALLNTNAINANITASNQKVLDALAQNKIDAMAARINQLELQQAVSGVVRYPNSFVYSAGNSPFCNGCCGC